VARAETEEELMQQVVVHAGAVHGMQEVPPEVAEKVKAAIKDE